METISSFASKYISENIKILQGLDPDQIAAAVQLVVQAGESGNRIYAIGNGGSASTASHFVNDMGKGASLGREKRVKVIP